MLPRLFFFLFLAAVSAPQAFAEETKTLFEPAPNFQKSTAFKILLKTKPGTKLYEHQKIEYLLERTANTSCTFIRNNESFPGKEASDHLRWKYSRRLKEVASAEDFARKIADSSRASQKDYLIQTKDGRLHKARAIYLNELKLLENELKKA